MKRMTEEWCKETENLTKWHKDRIPLLDQKISKLQEERDALQRVVDLADKLVKESRSE